MAVIQMTLDRNFTSRLQRQLHKKFETTFSKAHTVVTEGATEIYNKSLEQVPKDTSSLASSLEIITDYDTPKKLKIRVGYAITNDVYNEKSHSNVSTYMIAEHEELQLTHINGKAKFLEEPYREVKDAIASRLKSGG